MNKHKTKKEKLAGGLSFASLFSLLFLLSCHKQYLTGYYTREEFFNQCEWKTKIDNNYQPKPEWLDSIAGLDCKVDVRLYLGTYCPDSKKWVPRYFYLQNMLPTGKLEIISVDTTKKDQLGLAQRDSIKKIPTFLFIQGGKEIGRITENPKGRIEKALYKELKKCE